jgi:hypothetical protein
VQSEDPRHRRRFRAPRAPQSQHDRNRAELPPSLPMSHHRNFPARRACRATSLQRSTQDRKTLSKNELCPIGRGYLIGREARTTSMASLKGLAHDQKTKRFFHLCRQHCGAGDIAGRRPIARSCPARAGAVGADDGTATIHGVAAELCVRRAARPIQVSTWSPHVASVHAQSLIFVVASPAIQ